MISMKVVGGIFLLALLLVGVCSADTVGVLPMTLVPEPIVAESLAVTGNQSIDEATPVAEPPVVTVIVTSTPMPAPTTTDDQEVKLDGFMMIYIYIIGISLVIIYAVHLQLQHGKDGGVN